MFVKGYPGPSYKKKTKNQTVNQNLVDGAKITNNRNILSYLVLFVLAFSSRNGLTIWKSIW